MLTMPTIELSSLDFQPLSWVKARLSLIVKNLQSHGKKVVLTTNGRPTAVLLSYDDFLYLTSPQGSLLSNEKPINFEEWKKEKESREKVRDSVVSLFDISKLSRKGQKKYKEETVRELDR
ncbi:MAG: type II toxin-antitoxin system Phd/YefM family antitoxin [Deltaproteobacteria bacterium]|nr:MAG: type II toxin-antitoxin system Phd/YefM family antitoxin [Deltaproteobacteria bacterium]